MFSSAKLNNIAKQLMVMLAVALPMQSAFAQDAGALNAALGNGATFEAEGDFKAAARQYLNIVKSGQQSPYGNVSRETRAKICRRGLACLIRVAQSDASAYGGIMQAYRYMIELEPGNAAWPYLAGKGYATGGAFMPAEEMLKLATSSARGPESVKAKASALLAQIQPQIAQAHRMDGVAAANVQKAIARPLDWFNPGDYSVDTNQAVKNAANCGDSDAARRLSSGGGTSTDYSVYAR